MLLKNYQVETLGTLRTYLENCRVAGPKAAYKTIVAEPERKSRLGKLAEEYLPLAGLPDIPYVCLRLPTGGGKTLLAAHSISIAKDAWIEKDYPLVLWLTPTNAIRTQTLDALKNTRHAYRQVLDEQFDGRVRVFDISEMTHIRPQDLRDNCCIVIGTIQTLRVKNKEGRKVYAHNENFEPHFADVSPSSPGLDRLDEGPNKGDVKFSFANLLHLHHPLLIVDEAHNAVTGLSRDMKQRINPSAVIEFTATPRLQSNILHSVTARELKQEEMIKLPVVLSEHDTWQDAVNGAIATRAVLAENAAKDLRYIRPIVLFQAQPKNEEVTVEVLKDYLVDSEQVDETRVAVATGDQRQLEGLDLFDPDCPVEYVITIEALKEGWDCSFAYVFCSVANIRSATSVEQLLGRVLRMPFAERRDDPDLNKAYAHVSEPTFAAAANALRDKLVEMGFDEEEATEHIEPIEPRLDVEGGLFGHRKPELPTFKVEVDEPPDLSDLPPKYETRVKVVESGEGQSHVEIEGGLDPELEEYIVKKLPEPKRKALREEAAEYRNSVEDKLPPAERGISFNVPALVADLQGSLELVDAETLMEYFEWDLLDTPAKLSEAEFAIRETARSFEIDLDGNRLAFHFTSEEEQLALDVPVEGWTPENLAIWLDRQSKQIDIPQAKMLRWLRDLIDDLIGRRNINLSALMRCKFILARRIGEKLAQVREENRQRAFQQYLFEPTARVEVDFDNGFKFERSMYDDVSRYRGPYQFKKHFLGHYNVPAFDGVQDGEEFQCAQAIDSLPELKFWARNVARHPASFWLPTSSDRFYPDFVGELDDGRLLVIEYKGSHLAETADTKEKRTIGRLWQTASDGKGVFAVIEKSVDGKDMRAQLLELI